MKNVGIWMDKKKAIIVTVENEKELVQEVISEIEDFRPGGGSGSRVKGGPQDVVQDSKYLEREKNQYKKYFKTLLPFIQMADNIVIMGPAQAGIKFAKAVFNNYPHIYKKIIGVNKVDNMSNNQLKALVRDTFKAYA